MCSVRQTPCNVSPCARGGVERFRKTMRVRLPLNLGGVSPNLMGSSALYVGNTVTESGEEKASPPSPKTTLSPPAGCRHFKQATCSWPAPPSRAQPAKVRLRGGSRKFGGGEALLGTGVVKPHSPRFCRSSAYAAEDSKKKKFRMILARRSDGRLGLR